VVTLAGAARERRPFALLFLGGIAWFLLQSLLGAIWLAELALDGRTILEARRSATLVGLQVFGFHFAFILGVVVQAFPGFFATRRPTVAEVLPPIVLTQGGVGAVVLARVLAVFSDADLQLVENGGHIAFGAGVLWLGAYSGWWRGPWHMSRIARRFSLILWPAMAWLAIVGLLSVFIGVQAAADRSVPSSLELDTLLHVATVGVVLMLIVGMAQLILPEFASERIAGRQGRWRSLTFGVGLSVAVILRAGGHYFAGDLGRQGSSWSMALAGVIALTLTLVFTMLLVRSRRQHARMLADLEAGIPVTSTPRSLQ
jgi:hypothetical protein